LAEVIIPSLYGWMDFGLRLGSLVNSVVAPLLTVITEDLASGFSVIRFESTKQAGFYLCPKTGCG
jgi:hypothetical protein